MISNEWKRATRVLALAVLAVALTACGGSDDADSGSTGGGAAKGADGGAAAAGPDEATKSAAIRDAEQDLSALRAKAGELRQRAELDGVTAEASVQQAMSALDRQITDAQSKIGSLKSATGEAWATAESGAESAVSAAEQAASKLKGQIDSARAARRADAIAAEQTMLAQGLVLGLNGEEYEAYKRSVIEQAQEELTSLGLYAGPADGWLEASTKRALAALQEQNSLEASGVPTPKTRRVLRGESPYAVEE